MIIRPPEPEVAVRLWGYVTGLAGFPGFAELKRSVRERPQLPSFGVSQDTATAEEDRHAGSRDRALGLGADSGQQLARRYAR